MANTKDTSEYSSTKAPETQKHAQEKKGNFTDMRLIPGGARGSDQPQGMDALDRDLVPSGASDSGLVRHGDSRSELNQTRDVPE
ncbi:MAG TPA: hypothetical protein VF147_13125 [Vicinamibacterales bacterium]